jgi:hypothetical protein
MIVQYKKNCFVLGWFDTVLKMLKPQEEQFSMNPPGSGERMNNSNRTALSTFRRHLQSGIDYHI